MKYLIQTKMSLLILSNLSPINLIFVFIQKHIKNPPSAN
jgi:hypothetical protein